MSEARDLYREGFQHFLDDRLDEALETYRRAISLGLVLYTDAVVFE